MNVSLKYHASVYEDLDREAAAAARAARAQLPCSECGSTDGMQGGWTRKALKQLTHTILFSSKQPALFYLEGDDHELYQPCWQCNPLFTAHHRIPADFVPLTPEQVTAWMARECQCPDCVRERGKDE